MTGGNGTGARDSPSPLASAAEAHFLEGMRRIMPGYDLRLSYLAAGNPLRSSDASTDLIVDSSIGSPSASRSEITE